MLSILTTRKWDFFKKKSIFSIILLSSWKWFPKLAALLSLLCTLPQPAHNLLDLLLFLMENVLIAAFYSQRALYILPLLTLHIQLGKVYSVSCTIICHGWFCYNKIWTDGEWFAQELLAIWVTYRKKLAIGMQSLQ